MAMCIATLRFALRPPPFKRTDSGQVFASFKAGPPVARPDSMAEILPVHVTVVIPTRNEEAAIVDTIRSVPSDGWCEKLDFLIIDGNSTDRTRELAEGEGAAVYLESRKGYG
ncbi:MAG: hypothetical protein DSY41_03650, partial [Candidatus Poseidoniales archaeon]